MYSDVHKQLPRADDLFDGAPQCSNQTDVSLTSASDLETNIKSEGRVKKNILSINVQYCVYNLFIYFIHTLLYTLCITLSNGSVVAYVPILLIFDDYVTNTIHLFVVYKKTMLTKDNSVIRGFNCINLTSHDIGGRSCGGVSVIARDGTPYSKCTLNTILQAKAVTISTSKLLLFVRCICLQMRI